MKAKYVHTNIVAENWRKLANFYIDVFGCVIVPPQRNYSGKDLEFGVNIPGAILEGVHLRLPGHDINGPTLEIFTYHPQKERSHSIVNKPGFTHIAFMVDDVQKAREIVIANGGGEIGKTVTLSTSDGRKVTWCYLTDPEGNIIELQKWD